MPQQFDQSFKLLTEEDPRATLALFAGISFAGRLTVESLDRELNLSTLRVDNLYRCRDRRQEFLVHIEAIARYKVAVLERQFDYVQAIVAKYKLPCRSYLVFLTEKGVPETFPRVLRRKFGDHTATLRLRPVRLWRIAAARVLRWNNLQLLPWTPLLDATPAELREAFQRLQAADNGPLSNRLVLLGGLRYGSSETFLERLNEMILSEEVMQESSTYQYILGVGLKRGLAEGLAEGRTVGRTEGMREALAKQLIHRFGNLPAYAKKKLDSATPEKLDRWLEQVLDAPTCKDALK